MQLAPKVYVILVNYNGWSQTLECLHSLRELSYPNYQVVVVDNCSMDDSKSRIRLWATETSGRPPLKAEVTLNRDVSSGAEARISELAWVAERLDEREGDKSWPLIMIENTSNLGFSGGNNSGIRFGLSKRDSEFFWLLNNDTVVDGLALDELVKEFVDQDSVSTPIAMCGSLILDFDRRERVQAYGGAMVNRYLGTTKNLLSGEHMHSNIVTTRNSAPDYISGCSLLIKADRIDRTGLLNEDYFLYWEDTEWSYRCKRRGMGLAVARRSKVWHRRGSTSGRFPVIAFYNTRNCLRFFRDYLPAYLLFCLLARPLHFAAISLKHGNAAFFRESVRGYVEFLKPRRSA